MKYFEYYVSNTYAGSGNQLYFDTKGRIRTGRLFYKISVGGSVVYRVSVKRSWDHNFLPRVLFFYYTNKLYKLGQAQNFCTDRYMRSRGVFEV